MKKDNKHSSRNSFRMAMAFTLGAAALLAVPAVVAARGFGRGGRGMGRGMGHHRGGRGGGGMGMGRGVGQGVGKLMRGDLKQLKKVLGLSGHQVNQIKQLRKANQPKQVQVRLKMARIHAQMRVQWLADKPVAWKLKKLHQQKLKLKTKLANRRFNIRLKVVQILTPTQRMKLKRARGFGRRFAKNGKRGRGQRFGRRGGRGRF
jgi:Spy/CpxP family protein refolding chaperone